MSFQSQVQLSRQILNPLQKSSQGESLSNNKDLEELLNQNQKNQIQNNTVYFEFTEVFVWGDDQFGQLGLYHQKLKNKNKGFEQKNFTIPKTCSFNILIQQIACGEMHSAILTHQGHLYMMGSNTHGQLGIGEHSSEFQGKNWSGAPCLVDTLRDIKVVTVACGRNSSFAITMKQNKNEIEENSIIYSWGCNQFGQLGLQNQQNYNVPQKLKFFDSQETQIISISSGAEHTLFLSDLGKVHSCGSNYQGQLGIGEQQVQNNSQPLLIKELESYFIRQISAGEQHSLFLTQEGSVYSCGDNTQFQLGISQQQSQSFIPTQVNGLTNHQITKISAAKHSGCITNQGELFLWGIGVFGEYRTPQKILTISNQVTDLSLGGSLGVAIDTKGYVWSWGSNQYGELGVGDNDPRIHPYPVLSLKGKTVNQISCGGSFVIALGKNQKKEMPELKLLQKEQHPYQTRQVLDKNYKPKISKKSKNRSHSRKKNTSFKNSTQISNSSQNRTPLENAIKSPQNIQVIKKAHIKRGSKSITNKTYDKRQSIKNTEDSRKSTNSHSQHQQMQNSQQSVLSIKRSQSQLEINSSIINEKQTNHHSINSLREDKSDKISSTMNNSIYLQNFQDNYMLNCKSQKEKEIKELREEIKLLNNTMIQFKKENKHLNGQIEQLEKQNEKLKINSSSNSELVNVQSQLRAKINKIDKLKAQKQELKQQNNELQQKVTEHDNEKTNLQNNLDTLQNKLYHMSQQNVNFKDENDILKTSLYQYEQENQEIVKDVEFLKEQNQNVEQELLEKLQEITEKYKQSIQQQESLQNQVKQFQVQLIEQGNQIRDKDIYIRTIEQENLYLRDEIEKVKFQKDKEQYNKFLSGLQQTRKNKMQTSQKFTQENSYSSTKEQDTCLKESTKSPFKEIKNTSQILEDKNSEMKQSLNETKFQQQSKQQNELQDNYNQKLLKSIEKKTMKENSIPPHPFFQRDNVNYY